jgi:hypothetical protein
MCTELNLWHVRLDGCTRSIKINVRDISGLIGLLPFFSETIKLVSRSRTEMNLSGYMQLKVFPHYVGTYPSCTYKN